MMALDELSGKRGAGLTAFYNEIDPFAAAWLRELIKAGAIAPGIVDERSIEDIAPEELDGFSQCHFFAGIGAWSYAMRQSGWSDGRPVWTGSCPCQPFSAAGKGAGFADERHLWPAFFHLIEQCRPAIVFGEQVASKAVDPWIDLVQADLEAVGYAFGCVPFPSASVGAPHIRDRAYWVADSNKHRCDQGRIGISQAGDDGPIGDSTAGRLADSFRNEEHQEQQRPAENEGRWSANEPCGCRVVDAGGTTRPTNGFWRDVDWLFCRDGKWRPTQPKIFPLAHGVANRVGLLRGAGNAINAEAAQAFIMAFMGAA